jgi:glycosyltransferase involved in cell wall biosynthesis
LLFEPGDVPAFVAAVRRYFEEPELRERLRAAAVPSIAAYDADALYGRLESILQAAAR